MSDVYKRLSVFAELGEYDILAKKHDFIEVCEWHNRDGVDVFFEEKSISLTWGELKAIKSLVKDLKAARKDA